MKKYLFLISSILIVSCFKPINEKLLVENNGVMYALNSDKPYNGKFFGVHENGQKRIEGSFKNGILDGNYTEWFSNGQKKLFIKYKDKKILQRLDWNRDGTASINYQNLLGKGKWLYKKGDEAPYNGGVYDIHSNGVRSKEGMIINGIPEGLFYHFNENGVIVKETFYTKGKYNGVQKSWYDNGQILSERLYKNGVFVSSSFYNEDGTLVRSYPLKKDKEIKWSFGY